MSCQASSSWLDLPTTSHTNIPKSDDENYSLEPSSAAGSSRFPTIPFALHPERYRNQSHAQISPSSTLYSPDAEGASPAVDSQSSSECQHSNYDVDFLSEDATQAPDACKAGYLGQISEVQWLRNLKAQVQMHDSNSPAASSQFSETNFYMDEIGIQLVHQHNPFHLPPEVRATVLFQCYFQTVHITFPIISIDLKHQLGVYYHSARNGQDVTYSQRWCAIVNLVLAIGARFSRLTNAEWYDDPLDETLYISRAYQLLGLNDTAIIHATPDLSLIQACFVVHSLLHC